MQQTQWTVCQALLGAAINAGGSSDDESEDDDDGGEGGGQEEDDNNGEDASDLPAVKCWGVDTELIATLLMLSQC